MPEILENMIKSSRIIKLSAQLSLSLELIGLHLFITGLYSYTFGQILNMLIDMLIDSLRALACCS